MVDLINEEREEHILTIEDPIEFLHRHKKLHRQPARDRRRRDRLRQRAEVGPARGPRRDPRRRDARPGDDLDRADRGRDRPPRLRDPAHAVDRADGRPRSSTSSRRTSSSRCGCSSRSRSRGSSPSSCCRPPTARRGSCACEVLVPTPAIRNLIREGKTHQIYSALQTSGARRDADDGRPPRPARAHGQDHAPARRAARLGPRGAQAPARRHRGDERLAPARCPVGVG